MITAAKKEEQQQVNQHKNEESKLQQNKNLNNPQKIIVKQCHSRIQISTTDRISNNNQSYKAKPEQQHLTRDTDNSSKRRRVTANQPAQNEENRVAAE